MNLLKGDRIELKRHANNFDFLRFLGAFLVIVAHGHILLHGHAPENDFFKNLFGMDSGRCGVLIFFVISGFLVTKSWLNKTSFWSFLTARIFRIYPAALVVILLTVFVLGPLFSSLSLSDYFTHGLTRDYLLNLKIFHLEFFHLPGVFETNPHSGVNGSLWTLPHELACYISVILFGLLFLFKNKWLLLVSTVIFLLLWITYGSEIDKIFLPFLRLDFNHFYGLFLFFNMGSLMYLWKDKIPFNLFLGMVSLALLIGLNQLDIPRYFVVILIPYTVLCIAFSPLLPLQKIAKYGDFSYGLYIYAFPIQQIIIHFFKDYLNGLGFVIGATLVILIFAYGSWHWIEKPSMNLKKKLFN